MIYQHKGKHCVAAGEHDENPEYCSEVIAVKHGHDNEPLKDKKSEKQKERKIKSEERKSLEKKRVKKDEESKSKSRSDEKKTKSRSEEKKTKRTKSRSEEKKTKSRSEEKKTKSRSEEKKTKSRSEEKKTKKVREDSKNDRPKGSRSRSVKRRCTAKTSPDTAKLTPRKKQPAALKGMKGRVSMGGSISVYMFFRDHSRFITAIHVFVFVVGHPSHLD